MIQRDVAQRPGGGRVGAQLLRIPNADMGEITHHPLAVATLMLVRGQVDKPRGSTGPRAQSIEELYSGGLGELAGAAGESTLELVKDDLGNA